MDDMDEPILTEAADVNGTTPVGTAEGSDAARNERSTNDTGTSVSGALRPAFLSGLSTAMREAAVRERERITSSVAADAETHIEKVRSRAAIESEELRRLAEEDVEHIEQWSASEIERIRSEAAQKVEDRRSSLDEYLRQHESIIDTEIEGVNGAVRDYESTLDRFFAELSAIAEPSEIVRRAGQLPAPPDLDEIRATARARAMSRFSESEDAAPSESGGPADVLAATAESAGAAEAVVASSEPTVVAEAEPPVEPTEAMAGEDARAMSEGGDGVTMSGVMEDRSGSVEPGETTETPGESEVAATEEAPVAAAEAETQAPAEPTPEPVGVMDPDAQRAPNWPAPAPEAPPAQIAPTIDHTSAAVRLLRSVAPWTAPTHAGNRASTDSE